MFAVNPIAKNRFKKSKELLYIFKKFKTTAHLNAVLEILHNHMRTVPTESAARTLAQAEPLLLAAHSAQARRAGLAGDQHASCNTTSSSPTGNEISNLLPRSSHGPEDFLECNQIPSVTHQWGGALSAS